MTMIRTTLAPAADGTLHLPVPEAWRHLSIRVKAELEPVPADDPAPPANSHLRGFGCLAGQISMTPDFDAPLDDFKDYQ
jgi:hypothetical protein